MATGTDKFLNYNGLVKLIGLIKKRINDAVGGIDLSWKTNKFVKSITGYGTGSAPASTSGVNDTKNKLEGTYTTGCLDGTGTDVTTNKFTYIDTTYGAASTSKSGLMSSADKTKLDNLSATGASKGANLVKYDGTAATTAGSVAEAIKNLQGAVGGGDLVKQINTADQVSQINGSINYNPNTARTGNYTKANGDSATFTYYETTYDAATPDTGSGQAIVVGKTGLMSSADKTKLDNLNSSTVLLSSNITVDGTSKGNVQDALTALNALAAANKSAISVLKTIEFRKVSTLPAIADGETNVIYLVPHTHSNDSNLAASTGNIFDEYIKVNNGTTSSPSWVWEKIGSTDIDLSNYWNSSNLVAITNDEIDTAWSITSAAA